MDLEQNHTERNELGAKSTQKKRKKCVEPQILIMINGNYC